ncbi:hypothetical protein R1sor_021451 [Riccia sorocarpa]|uniref:Bifunctional inhibitor/plant lipid transfer protein/seed storage helical domain-containing protein n=1 Tax=Riccia sorocarpa TaxID=122646 RepID=A0ABD3GH35_9MARC
MSTSTKMSMVLFVAVLCLVPSALVQAQAPPPLDCSDALTNLLSCFDFVSGTNDTIPQECCDALTGVRANTPLCLCTFLTANTTDLGINATRALELPGKCGVTADPSQCPGAGPSPAAAPPATSPTAPVPATPVSAPVPSGTPVPPTVAPSPQSSPPPATSPSVAPATPPPALTPTTAPTVAPTVSPVAAPPPTVVAAPTADCSSEIRNLDPCLNFVVSGTVDAPSAECCGNFTSVATDSPSCLCSLVNAGSDAIPGLNVARALQLPTLCNTAFDATICTSTPTPPTGQPTPPGGSGASLTVASPVVTVLFVIVAALQLLL